VRVLLLTTELGGYGGVQYAGRLLARAVRDCVGPRAELTVLSLADSPPTLKRLAPGWHAVAASGNRFRTAWAGFRLSRRRWDLILLGHVNLAPLALFFRRRRAPLVPVVYGIEAWRAIRGLGCLGLARAARIFYISQHTRTLAELANPWLCRTPGFVCHLGLLPQPAGGDSERQEFEPFALCVGRMSSKERYKGHEELIRVWPRVRLERPGLRLVLLGDGDDRHRLEGLAGPRQEGIEFLGTVDDATRDRYLRRCRCFCLPARGEGLGLAYLEAMRLGKPVLAGDKDAGREVVVDGVTGRTVDPLDEAAILRGVLHVSGPQSHDMGAAGRRRFAEHFDYAPFLVRFSRHLEEILARPRGASGAAEGAGTR
jgi:glycosyltransferase involved in cell wall biosynthesis